MTKLKGLIPFGLSSKSTHFASIRKDNQKSIIHLFYRITCSPRDLARLCLTREGHLTQGAELYGLWEKTCFECFFFTSSSEYYEINISTLGEWFFHHFDSYREPSSQNMKSKLRFNGKYQYKNNALELNLALNIDKAQFDKITKAQIALIWEQIDNAKVFLTTKHNQPRPDFHDKSAAFEF